MSMTDQARAYLALRETITALRQEFGDDTAWHIVEKAVQANIADRNILIHKVSKPQLKHLLRHENQGEIA